MALMKIRFAIRSHCFMDAYHKGLNGKQAAWAVKQYQGHHVLPSAIMSELKGAHLNEHSLHIISSYNCHILTCTY